METGLHGLIFGQLDSASRSKNLAVGYCETGSVARKRSDRAGSLERSGNALKGQTWDMRDFKSKSNVEPDTG